MWHCCLLFHVPAGMRYAAAMANYVQAVLNGSTDPDPAQHGMTTEQERVASLATQVRGHYTSECCC
jgi:hypothetical protein